MTRHLHHYVQGPFAKGATVRLKEGFAMALMKSSKGRGGKVDWVHRRGTVKTCNQYQVSIMWPGRAAADQFPVGAVEEVTT